MGMELSLINDRWCMPGSDGYGFGIQYCIAFTDENRLMTPEELMIDLNITPVYIQKI